MLLSLLLSMAAYVNGKSILANLSTLNFQNGDFLYSYQYIFTTTYLFTPSPNYDF